jgi:hypothetical protein
MEIQIIENVETMPFFPELPYWLWGEVNYNSEGDCKKPTDINWHSIELRNRDTKASISIERTNTEIKIQSDTLELINPIIDLINYTNSKAVDTNKYSGHIKRTRRIREEFSNNALEPFDNHYFWGSWKWVGWFATDFTWVGRWILNSLHNKDKRGVNLCATWLNDRKLPAIQEKALIYGINTLCNMTLKDKSDFDKWWKGGFFNRKLSGKLLYTDPDFDKWLIDLKEENKKWE